jgi:hypothetical protein
MLYRFILLSNYFFCIFSAIFIGADMNIGVERIKNSASAWPRFFRHGKTLLPRVVFIFFDARKTFPGVKKMLMVYTLPR